MNVMRSILIGTICHLVMTDLIKGIDVSSLQGVISWGQVSASGVKFMIHRCCIGNNAGIDKMYLSNLKAAKSEGIVTACYQFLFPLPNIDPIQQANTHYQASSGELPCIDLEWPSQQEFGKWGCSATQIREWAKAYLNEYERLANRVPVLYVYPAYAQELALTSEDVGRYPLWIASYTNAPAVPKAWNGSWSLWQYSGSGSCLGINAKVDLDYAQDLSLWNTVTAIPETTDPAIHVAIDPAAFIPTTS